MRICFLSFFFGEMKMNPIPLKDFYTSKVILGDCDSRSAVLALSVANPPQKSGAYLSSMDRWDHKETEVVGLADVQIIQDIENIIIVKLSAQLETDDKKMLLCVDTGRNFFAPRMAYGWAKGKKGNPQKVFESNQFSIWILEMGDEVEIHECDEHFRKGQNQIIRC